MNLIRGDRRKLGKQALSFALVFGIWFAPIPAGLTKEAWHLFAVFAAAIFSVIVNAFPLLTASLLAVGAAVLTGTVTRPRPLPVSRTRACFWSWSPSWWQMR